MTIHPLTTPQSIKSITYTGLNQGIRLIVLGAVHGNETCGTQGIQRIMAELDSGLLEIHSGQVTFIPITNPLAYQLVQRSGDRNLNRNLCPTDAPQDFEDHIANALCPLLAAHDVLLDLHSFHAAGGEPFIMLGPENNTRDLEPFALAAEEEALAVRLGPRRIVDGWLDTYARGVHNRLNNPQISDRAQLLNTDPRYGVGTTEYMRAHGGYALTLECGQHNDPQAPEIAYQAIRNTLAHLQLVDLPCPTVQTQLEVLRIDEVIDKQHVADRFHKAWVSFDLLTKGDPIGIREDGSDVQASRSGFILFPNPTALPGNEWFYYAKRSERGIDGIVAS
ncbi:MAG: succinylglutamate desuccinylase/aspartoacylase family protein [Methylococcales bacterium]|nr:succinylglutamate desuccinylase/aspartoacylase family protein [Methylococcales bacterium]